MSVPSSSPVCSIKETDSFHFNRSKPKPFYGIYLFHGTGKVEVDFTSYSFDGITILFTTPYQIVQLTSQDHFAVRAVEFHGDYYCIEYHKKEVACNGLLFNNIYSAPFLALKEQTYAEIHSLMDKLSAELLFSDSYSRAIAQSYLQLILAICSKVKVLLENSQTTASALNLNTKTAAEFRQLLELHFKQERSVAFYALQLGMAVNTLSKQCRSHFHKSPTFLIQERVVLEAKKLIHLTFKSMKEIATELSFEDQHYFSRYFKKHTGVSPVAFRKNVGISSVAYSSI